MLLLIFSALVLLAISGLSVIENRRFGRKIGKPAGFVDDTYRPMAFVIVPFKGVDDGGAMAAGLLALCSQDYPAYRLLCVVDSEDDPACAVIREAIEASAGRAGFAAELLVAGSAGPNEGQKIHNQLYALDRIALDPGLDPEKLGVYVFADSDAVVGDRWLGDMVGPLEKRERIGMTTGYRYLVPVSEKKASGSGVWDSAASLLNSSVAVYHARRYFPQAWGGSMAMTAAVAERGGLRESLEGALTDDYQFTRVCRRLKLEVFYVRSCLVLTPVDFTAQTFTNFVRRQYLITRVYHPLLFAFALVVTGLYVYASISLIGFSLVRLVADRGDAVGWIGVGVLGLTHLLNHVRSWYRRRFVAKWFGDAAMKPLCKPGGTLWLDRWMTLGWMSLHHGLILSTVIGRTMVWRGIRYRLRGRQRIEKLQ